MIPIFLYTKGFFVYMKKFEAHYLKAYLSMINREIRDFLIKNQVRFFCLKAIDAVILID